MRPAILRWKVTLALLAVVVAGGILGSVLHSPPKPFSTYFTVPAQVWKTSLRNAPPMSIGSLPKVPKHALFILGPAPRSPQDRLRAWLFSTLLH